MSIRALFVAASMVVVAAASVPAGAQVSSESDVSGVEFSSPDRLLRYGSAKQAHLAPEHVDLIEDAAAAGLSPSPTYPRYPGFVVLAARRGVIAEHSAQGHAYKYADDEPTLLPPEQRVAMRKDTIFDLASISKLFTSIAVVQLIEKGSVGLDEPVATYVPEFGQNGKSEITVRMLLTHTSGLAAWAPLYSRYATPEERMRAIYESAPSYEPGTDYVYSDLGMIVAGEIVERASGVTLDSYVARHITGPLGMSDTSYNPPASEVERIAATEYQPWTNRGMIRGSVHDENAWSLGGVAGHAGVFSTAYDLALLSQALLNGGAYNGERILEPESVESLLTNFNERFPGDEHGLGFELYQHWYMDAMSTPITAGHTGYTGTSLVIDFQSHSFAVLLTNRVHPSRGWGSVNPYRRAVARAAGRSVPVAPATGNGSWFSGIEDGVDRSLTFPVSAPSGPKTVEARLFYDTEPNSDFLYAEWSGDKGENWTRLTGVTTGSDDSPTPTDGSFTGYADRRWRNAVFDFSDAEGETLVRFRYASDALYSGRGAYVDAIKVRGPQGVLFDSARSSDAERIDEGGWAESHN